MKTVLLSSYQTACFPVSMIATKTEKQAQRLERKARKLYALRLIDPRDPQYEIAGRLMDKARALRATL